MKKVRAKVAHTLEPGTRYIHAGDEAEIEDHQFDEAVHEKIDTEAEASKEPAGPASVTLPPPKDTLRPKKPAPADMQASTPPKPEYPKAPTEFGTDIPPIGPQPDVVPTPVPRSPSVAPTPAQASPAEPALSSPTPPESGLLKDKELP